MLRKVTSSPAADRIPLSKLSGYLDDAWLAPSIARLADVPIPDGTTLVENDGIWSATGATTPFYEPDQVTIVAGEDRILHAVSSQPIDASTLPAAHKIPRAHATAYLDDGWLSPQILRSIHSHKIASTTELGHVKVDGISVTIDADGVISAGGALIDASQSPLPNKLPRAYDTGRIDDGWLSPNIARTAALNSHRQVIASYSDLGHVRLDNQTIKIDGNGRIYVAGFPQATVVPTPDRIPMSRPSGTLMAGWLNQHVQSTKLASGESLSIPAEHQLVVYGRYDIVGDLELLGDLIVLDEPGAGGSGGGVSLTLAGTKEVIGEDEQVRVVDDFQYLVLDTLDIEGELDLDGGTLAILLDDSDTTTVIQPGGEGGSDAFYQYAQIASAAVWTVQHNLNKYPSVVVVDTLGYQVQTNVRYLWTARCTQRVRHRLKPADNFPSF